MSRPQPTCDRLIDGVKCKLSEDGQRLGLDMREVPPSRHAWSDVLVCPNDDCGRQFLVLNMKQAWARYQESHANAGNVSDDKPNG